METNYTRNTLVEIDQDLDNLPGNVILTGTNLTIPEIVAVARKNATVNFTKNPDVLKRIKQCYEAMSQNVKDGLSIYGLIPDENAQTRSEQFEHCSSEE